MKEFIDDDFVEDLTDRAISAFWDTVVDGLPDYEYSGDLQLQNDTDFNDACRKAVELAVQNALHEFEVVLTREVTVTVKVKALSEAHARIEMDNRYYYDDLFDEGDPVFDEGPWKLQYVGEE